jgi:GAF domain-containing protein
MEMSVRGTNIIYTCKDCSHDWAERRIGAIVYDDTARRGEAAHHAVEAICAADDLPALITATRAWARHLTAADGVTFVLRAGNSCYYADEDAIAPLWKGQRFPIESCVSGWVMQQRESVIIPDIYADARVPHDVYRPTFVRSMLMAPVRKADPIAAIGAYWSVECAPTHSHVQLIELLAEAAAVRLTSDQLWPRAKDAMTALG